MDGTGRQIIGVLPQKFHFLDWEDPALILPFRFDRNKTHLGNFSYDGIARLKPGFTLQQVNADIARMLPIVMNSFPPPPGFSLKLFEDARIGPNARPLKQDVVGDVGNVLWVLMGSIGMVLLIACANAANLLLVRVEGRRQELALRAALGASWTQIAGELLLESVVLGLLGSAVGLGLAYGALRILAAIAPSGLPRIHEIGIDGPVRLFTLLVALLASLLVCCVPIIKYSGARLTTGIREGARGLSQSKEQHRARGVLVVVQVALALVLLICSGLMIRTFRALTKVNPGFTRPAELQTFRISIPETQVKEPERVVRMEEEVLHKIEAIPGASSVSIGTVIPMVEGGWHDPIFVEGDTVILQQVLLNLVSNGMDALEHVSSSHKKLTLTAMVRLEANSGMILVEDNGCGIAETDKSRLFTPFFTTKEDGLGMGLSICRSLIESLNGHITLLDRAEPGAAFLVELPLAAHGDCGAELDFQLEQSLPLVLPGSGPGRQPGTLCTPRAE